jgi:beta-galactosidase GanA
MNHFVNKLKLILILFAVVSITGYAQVKESPVPKIIEKNGRHALLVDGQPFLILGGQAHNSSAWPGMMPQVWQAIETMHANTLEVPIYWEQIEPQPGKFNFSLIDTLLVQARERDKHLVLLWFATWKNGSNHYMPEWMKLDSKKYSNISGKNGQPVDSPSPHAKAAMEADAKAFTAVMKHLKDADPQHTVLMVQVENEPGAWGSEIGRAHV